ncbi:MAG: ABC transporter substrate-binding protein [Defluviitaleaceae bacterium]|nr:ABC transporter substrate-binding protein [Defluviitaleaceae bacterium]
MKKLVILLLVVMAVFAACGNNDGDGYGEGRQETPPPTGGGGEPVEFVEAGDGDSPMHPALLEALRAFPAYTTNDAPVLPRGSGTDNILRIGVGTSSTLIGLFLGTHNADANDASINELAGSYSLVSWDANNLWTQNGIATLELDREANVIILNMQEYVYWHDGVPLTLDDLVFAYEIIGHPEYTGQRFSPELQVPNVRGMAEYHAGQADYISGLVLSNNNRTLRIYYVDPLPPSTLFAGSVWLQPIPRHWIEPAIAEVGHYGLQGHIRARDQILGFGPFIIETVVAGESVFMIPNDNYRQGAPLVDGVLVELLPFEMVPSAMRAGDFDIAAYQTANLSEFYLHNPTNYSLFGWPAGATTIINFRMGGFGEPETDDDGNVIGAARVQARDDDHPIMNVAIRRALAHSIDRETIAHTVGHDMWIPAPSILHPFNASPFIDINRQGIVFDLELSNRILDEAGFTQRDAEGYRLDLDGNHMYFVYGQQSNPTHDQLVPLNIQNWREIGLRVEMFEGGFMDWGLFLDTVAFTDEVSPIHIFAMGWALGMNPDPASLWADTAQFNMSRYSSPGFAQILYDIQSANAWDAAFLADAYDRWEQYFYENVPALQFTWNLDLVAVNNRVTNFSRVRVDNGYNEPGNMTTDSWANHLIGLTARSPYAN